MLSGSPRKCWYAIPVHTVSHWALIKYHDVVLFWCCCKVASALMTMGLASTLGCCDGSVDRVDQAEELCQNLLIVLFTIMSKGIDSSEESAWKVSIWRRRKKISHRQLGLLHESSSPLWCFELVRVKPNWASIQWCNPSRLDGRLCWQRTFLS